MLPRNSRDCMRTAAIARKSDDSSATLSRSAGEQVIFAPGRRKAQIEQRRGDNPKHPRSCEFGPWWPLVFEGARAARVIPLSNDNRLAAQYRAAWRAVERSASVLGRKDRFSMNRFATNATRLPRFAVRGSFSALHVQRWTAARSALARPKNVNKRTKRREISVKGYNGIETCNAGSRRSASLPRAFADHLSYRMRARIAQERVPTSSPFGSADVIRRRCSAAVFEFFPAAARALSVSSNLRLSRYRGAGPGNLVQARFETPETTNQRNEVLNNTIKSPHLFRSLKVYFLGTRFSVPGRFDRINSLFPPRIIIPFFPHPGRRD